MDIYKLMRPFLENFIFWPTPPLTDHYVLAGRAEVCEADVKELALLETN